MSHIYTVEPDGHVSVLHVETRVSARADNRVTALEHLTDVLGARLDEARRGSAEVIDLFPAEVQA